jgi:hypothetical protein
MYSRLWKNYYNTSHETQVTIENALLYPDSTRTLLSYRDIRKNGLQIVTHEENNKESLLVTKTNGNGYDTLEKYLHSRLDCTIHT